MIRSLGEYLSRIKTLKVTFLSTVLMTAIFGVIMQIWQFGVIDEIYDPEKIIAHLNGMSASQKTIHAWMTATLDVVYPFSYGSFFIGMALRYFSRLGPFLAIPSIAVIPVDLTEGLIQVLLLNGNETVIWIKAIVTPLKLGLFLFGLCVAIIGLFIAMFQTIKR